MMLMMIMMMLLLLLMLMILMIMIMMMKRMAKMLVVMLMIMMMIMMMLMIMMVIMLVDPGYLKRVDMTSHHHPLPPWTILCIIICLMFLLTIFSSREDMFTAHWAFSFLGAS